MEPGRDGGSGQRAARELILENFWISQGTPTSLVHNGTIEGSDPVANGPIKVLLTSRSLRMELDLWHQLAQHQQRPASGGPAPQS